MFQEVPESKTHFSTDAKLKVTLLGSEWTSSAGGLSTLNRELAIHLVQHPKVEVSLLVPEGACKDEDKKEAKRYGVTVLDAKERPGYDPLDWLSVPPQDLSMDVVVGHGVKLGKQVQFIKVSPHFSNCKWVQVVHTAPEDLSRYKGYPEPISKGEKKHQVEVDLCKMADLVVPVGPRLEDFYSSYLRRCKENQDIFTVTPGLFEREFGDLKQAPNESGEFKVLLCGRGDDEDFQLKGYNIAVEAFSDPRLKRKPYHLIFVGAPEGKQDAVREKLLRCGIAEEQLTVRKFVQSREGLKDLFCEVDLAIMPSKSEGFGLVALEALSAGLPILVGSKSGLARALENIPIGRSCIVNSDDPAKWAEAIEGVRVRHRVQLEEVKLLRASYDKKYSWKQQCEDFVEIVWRMVHGPSRGSGELTKEASHIEQNSGAVVPDTLSLGQQPFYDGVKKRSGTSGEGASTSEQSPQIRENPSIPGSPFDLEGNSSKVPRIEPLVEQQSAAVTPHAVHGPLCPEQQSPPGEEKGVSETLSLSEVEGTLLLKLKVTTQNLDVEQQKIFSEHFKQYIELYMKYNTVCPSNQPHEGVSGFFKQLEDVHNALVKAFKLGCLEIVVQCPTLESLESLWIDYYSGHLNEEAERFLVTDELKRKLNVETVRLKTTISEESYFMCKKALKEMPRQANSSGLLPEHTDPTEKDSRQPDEFQKDRKQSMNWMTRAERAKASRSALHKASITGLSETVKMLLDSGEDVDQRDQFSLTPLHLACGYGQESVARLLLEHGANVNALDRFQRTALQKAERQSHRSIVQLLLENNVTPSFQQPSSLKILARKAVLKVDRRSGFNLLQAAVLEADYSIVSKASALLDDFVKEMNVETTGNCTYVFSGKSAAEILSSLERRRPGHGEIDQLYQGMVEKVKTLTELHWCANSADGEKVIELVLNDGLHINIPTESNCTPLLWASQSSSSMLIKTLIDLGADVNAQRTDDKASPLLLAAYSNNYMATRLLLEHGADANIETTDGYTPLLWSIHQGLFSICHLLMQSRCNVNLRNKAGKTPLHLAIEESDETLVKLLLKNNADVNIQNVNGDTPLHVSALRGFFNISQMLIESGCKINVRNNKGETPLHIAVKKNDETLVKLLLEKNADGNFVDRYGDTPLHVSARVEFFHISQLLIESGCKIDAMNNKGETPLHIAVKKHDETHVKLLLESNADVNFRDRCGDTPLHVSARIEFFNISELLINSGCNVNVMNNKGETPIHIAVKKNDETLVKLLLENNADVNFVDRYGDSPLHVSARIGFFNIPELLIESGCKINLMNCEGETPLHIAVKKNDETLIKLLLENNADVTFEDCYGDTPLHVSARIGLFSISELLIEPGCKINLRNSKGETPLHIAVKKNDEPLVKLLLENNADVNFGDCNGDTPLHVSARVRFFNISQLLIESRCKISVMNNKGETPLHIAVKKHDETLVKFLLENNADVNFGHRCGDTPLHVSARMGFHCFNVSRLLIESGCKINLRNNKGETAIYIAVKKNDETLVKFLLKNNADVNFGHRCGDTPLHVSARMGFHCFNISRLLIESGCKINLRNNKGETPLYIAVKKNDETLVKLLLEKNADVNIQGPNGGTLLGECARRGFSNISQLLIDWGCNINVNNSYSDSPLHDAVEENDETLINQLLEKNANVNIQGRDGDTPLHISARMGFFNISQLLIASGCNINLMNNKGETPLHIAIDRNDETLVKLLLEKKADVDIQDLDGDTPLHLSARGNFINISKLLIESECNINLRNFYSGTPLHMAVTINDETLVKLLLKNNADVNIQGPCGDRPLHISARRDFINISKLLIESGCNVDLRDYYGDTPLHIAVKINDETLVKLLLKYNADVNIQGPDGNTPLHVCARREFINISKLLIESGCIINLRNSFGETPLDLAIRECNETLVQLLLENDAQRSVYQEGYSPVQKSWRGKERKTWKGYKRSKPVEPKNQTGEARDPKQLHKPAGPSLLSEVETGEPDKPSFKFEKC